MRTVAIESRVTELRSMSDFDLPLWWLTFYLTAPSSNLAALAREVKLLGAVNLTGSDFGFLYPKIKVSSDPQSVVALISQVEQLAAGCSVEIIQVDADTSADVRASKFEEIIRY
jgi:hypothetical protein